MAAAEQIGREGLKSLPSVDVLVLGEVHDNPHHHAAQAEAVAAMRPSAIVFEMLTEAQAAAVTPENRADRETLAEALAWEDAGWPDFAMYYPIFVAAPDAQIYGAALPREEVRRAVAEGAESVFGFDASRFGLDRPLPEAELAVQIAEQAEAHCNALPEELLPGMVEAQRLRDAALARAALTALDETGGAVAIITGNGHARRDRGVPSYLAAVRSDVTVLAVGQLEAVPEDPPPFDLWHVTEPAERPDPCEAFR